MSTVKASYYEKPTACQIIMAIFLSPVGVAMRHGCGKELAINLGCFAASIAFGFLLGFLSVIVGIPFLVYVNPFGLIGWIYGIYVVFKHEVPPVGHYYA